MPAGVHSHGLAPASARRLSAPRSFRPRRSSRPRRLAPPTGSRACCIPHPTLRFAGFPRTRVACLRSRPRVLTGAYPPELFPSEKRSPRHREALPPCRSPASPARLRGLVPLGSPSQRWLVAEPSCSMLSWASPLGALHEPTKPGPKATTTSRSQGEEGPGDVTVAPRRLPSPPSVRPPKRRSPPARPRAVRSAGAIEGVHGAGGLSGSRSATRGGVIRARPPHPRREGRFLLSSAPRVCPVATAPHRCDPCADPNVWGDVLQALFVRQRATRGSPRRYTSQIGRAHV